MDSDDEYIVQDFSDEGGIDSSSDDELVMKEFEKQSKSVRQGSRKLVDDFEADMRDELEQRATDIQKLEDFTIPGSSAKPVITETSQNRESNSSDSEDDNLESGKNDANADLFYDPEMDSKDEAWVNRQRKKYHFDSKTAKGKVKPLPNSDAVLNCPACFTSLSRDCQRHEIYKSQYRAMFTFNCTVDKSTTLKYPLQSAKGKKLKKNKADDTTSDTNNEEMYHPVRCSVCDTQVAVFDKDEVFHFFNVVTSH